MSIDPSIDPFTAAVVFSFIVLLVVLGYAVGLLQRKELRRMRTAREPLRDLVQATQPDQSYSLESRRFQADALYGRWVVVRPGLIQLLELSRSSTTRRRRH